uniref:Uncharacterized protein n=1 Tax=Aegilops tauschii subsp. strangulata TaxID=200361 RepID=A0A453FY52_AEGTS
GLTPVRSTRRDSTRRQGPVVLLRPAEATHELLPAPLGHPPYKLLPAAATQELLHRGRPPRELLPPRSRAPPPRARPHPHTTEASTARAPPRAAEASTARAPPAAVSGDTCRAATPQELVSPACDVKKGEKVSVGWGGRVDKP